MTDTARVREVLETIMADAETDAMALDARPFNARSVGEALGNMLAQVQAVAKISLFLLDELERRAQYEH